MKAPAATPSAVVRAKPESQADRILKHLKKGGRLTALDALREYNCLRLAARVNDLRNEGYDIASITVKRDGKAFAQYYLPQRVEQGKLDF